MTLCRVGHGFNLLFFLLFFHGVGFGSFLLHLVFNLILFTFLILFFRLFFFRFITFFLFAFTLSLGSSRNWRNYQHNSRE
ncbi:MAG TPA: hypothetical protein DHN29_24275 [Cytophagales bacterium]|nr:hypothetical protein [Cytophagales bacterium]